jgi:hypothetical protein
VIANAVYSWRDDLRYVADHIRVPTVFDLTLPPRSSLSIKRISVVLFEDEGKPLSLNHELWWTSILKFNVNGHDVYAWPLHRFVDPVMIFAASNGLELEAARRCIAAMGQDFEYPYNLLCMERALVIIEPRNSNRIPLASSALVMLSGTLQRMVSV